MGRFVQAKAHATTQTASFDHGVPFDERFGQPGRIDGTPVQPRGSLGMGPADWFGSWFLGEFDEFIKTITDDLP
jgi:hypothetical protein